MYTSPTTPIAAGVAGGLPFAVGMSPFWAFLAAFALIAAGSALARIVPRVER